MTIAGITTTYFRKVDSADIQILIAHAIGKSREFVLAHPEHALSAHQASDVERLIKRRIKGEPIAYITGRKEFYGLDFAVNRHTLVPRPETEFIVENALSSAISNQSSEKICVIDVGTGSGNIIISIAHELEKYTKYKMRDTRYFAIDISREALKIARKNAKNHDLDQKIRFLNGNLLEPIAKKLMELTPNKLIITANLPYLSEEIYESAPRDVKNFEPKSALYSPKQGLQHYEKLLKQIKKLHASCSMLHISCFMEISPEQKQPLAEFIKEALPSAKASFTKDLAGKWRVCKISI